MQVVQAAAPAALPDLAPGFRLVRKMDGETNGVAWAVFEDLTLYVFGFTTSAGFTSAATYANATRAGKEAERWCAAYKAEPVFATVELEIVGAEDFTAAVYGEPEVTGATELIADAVEYLTAPPARNPVGEHMIDGWRIVVGDDRGGTYQAQAFRPDGSAGEAFTGYESAGVALSDAAVWCSGQAVDAMPPVRVRILHAVKSDFPGLPGPRLVVEPGLYMAESNRFGALSIRTPGGMLGIKPGEFERVEGDFEEDVEAAGWRIFAAKLRGGKFEPVLIDASTGEEGNLGALVGAGLDTREEAIEFGTTWAINNPTQAAVDKTDRIWSRVDAARRPALEADMSRAAARLELDTAELEAENARLARENATLRQRLADIDTAQVQAAEAATRNAAAREALNAERARLVDLGKANKLAIKGIDAQLLALSADGLEMVEKMGSRQLVLIPGARSKAAIAESTLRSTWTHGGVDYSLEARENADGWRSWVHGYEATTEGVGPEREDAERETKDRAVAVLPNAGGLRPPPRVEVPVTEKPRRGRKPKAVAT